MATTRDIVERAYRKIGVVAGDEPMTADQAAAGLAALNDMMFSWELEGIDIGHSELALSDEFSLPPRFNEGAVYLLSMRLAPDNAAQGVNGDKWRRMLQAAYYAAPKATMPAALTVTHWWRR